MSLLERPNFRSLWAAHTISTLGTTFGALSLTALVYLHATPVQLGLLAAATSIPVFLIALIAGVWVDRLPRVPVLVATDLGRFAVLLTVPAVALFGGLRMEQLYVVAFVVGCMEVVFEIAFRSALPVFVPRDRLVEANSALGMSSSVARTTGPAFGGGIAQSVGAPVGVFVDALTFLASGLFLLRLPASTAGPPPRRRPLRAETLEGLRAVLHHPSLRPIFAMVLSYSFFSGFIITLYGLWIIKGLGFSALTLGLLLATGGVGSLLGAVGANPVARHLGVGRGIVASYVLAAGISFLTPLAAGPTWLILAMLISEQFVGDILWTTHNVQAVSLRQSVTPDDQLGRVNAVFLLGSEGLRPLGAVVAGIVATVISVKAGLLIASTGISLAGLWLIFSPLRHAAPHDST